METAAGSPYTRRVDVETYDLDGWADMRRRLLREIEKVELTQTARVA